MDIAAGAENENAAAFSEKERKTSLSIG